MAGQKIGAALRQFQEELEIFERVVVELVQRKKEMHNSPEDASQLINQINEQLQQKPIAIIGIASIFPESKNLEEYWEKIVNKVDCITDVPASHWSAEDYYDPDPKAQDKTYCKRGGFIPKIDFNPVEFGLPPNLLEATDVSQLLALEVAKQAMEDAGYGKSREFDRERVGVILGVAGTQLATPFSARIQYPVWEKVLKNCGLSDEDTQKIVEKIKSAYIQWEENSFPGMLSNVVSGRIANRLDFGGINCTIDAACASSLAAVKMAISELAEQSCHMVLTGGVDADNSIFTYLCFSKTPALSRSQQIRPFDADSDGMIVGEGLGMVVLKRLEDAERDGDRIYAVIKGVGTSSDGRYKSIYAPRPEGQVKALHRTYQSSGIPPETVQLIEAHGTGTAAGDPAEFQALKMFFGERITEPDRIALGSVKSQIGHTKAAAGAASLIKVSLALHHKILPATINVTKPNPKLGIENSPFYLNTETRPWIQAPGAPPRRAGVSSFGFGGTNYHIVIEEYQQEHTQSYRLHPVPQSVLLYAETPEQLLIRCEEVLSQLQSKSADRLFSELINACKSSEIPATAARLGFVATSAAEACDKLHTSINLLNLKTGESWEHPNCIYYRQSALSLTGKVVALFPGQGSQYLEMGRELTMNFPELRQTYGYLDRLLKEDQLQPVSSVVFPPAAFELAQQTEQNKQLQRTEYAQPAIAACSAGFYKILHQAGFKPDFVAGHSFGELTALWAAGALSDEDYFFLVKMRGQAMSTPNISGFDAGTMLAVTGNVSQIETLLQQFPQISIANFNSNQQVVLAGAQQEVVEIQKLLTEKGFSAVLLPVSGAFHTSRVAHAQEPFARALDQVTFKSPDIATYSNVTADRYPESPQEIKKTLKEHLSHSVCFKQEIENIYRAGGYCFVEIGPRSILTHLVKEILGDRPHIAISLNASRQKDSDRQLREAVVQLQVAGLSLQNLDPYQLPQKMPELPGKKAFTVPLNGSNYVGEKTRQMFEQALQDGYKVQLLPTQPETPANLRLLTTAVAESSVMTAESSEVSTEYKTLTLTEPVSVEQLHDIQSQDKLSQELVLPTFQIIDISANSHILSSEPMANLSLDYQRVLGSLESSIAQFSQHQGETLQVHGQYLNNQLEHAKIFFHLIQQQSNLLTSNDTHQSADTKIAVVESLERSMMRLHEHQAETLRVHEQSLSYQAEHGKSFFQLVQQQYSLLVGDNLSGSEQMAAPSRISDTHNQPVALTVSEEASLTFPAQSLEPPTQSFSSNGKHATQEAAKTASNELELLSTDTPTTPLAETAKQADISAQSNGSAFSSAPLPAPQSVSPEPIANGNGNGNGNHASLKDSVSQPQLDTLFQVAPITPAVFEQDSVVTNGKHPAQDLPIVAVESITSVSSPAFDKLSQILLEVVSEKTGYPPEMLELDMDMEADLGIDSIKRLEILGALQTHFPDLPKSNSEDLGEIRTLSQIVESMKVLMAPSPVAPSPVAPTEISSSVSLVTNGASSTQATPALTLGVLPIMAEAAATVPEATVPEATVPTSAGADASTVPAFDKFGQVLLEVVSEKTGYPPEMLELDMDMEADLGIDSIKRLEILGALQTHFPDLPKSNSEDLGEIRTLSQIVEQIKRQALALLSEKKTVRNPIMAGSSS